MAYEEYDEYGGSRCFQIATPVIIPNGGMFEGSVVVTITCSTPGVTIYYTTDGSYPQKFEPYRYTGPFLLTEMEESLTQYSVPNVCATGLVSVVTLIF